MPASSELADFTVDTQRVQPVENQSGEGHKLAVPGCRLQVLQIFRVIDNSDCDTSDFTIFVKYRPTAHTRHDRRITEGIEAIGIGVDHILEIFAFTADGGARPMSDRGGSQFWSGIDQVPRLAGRLDLRGISAKIAGRVVNDPGIPGQLGDMLGCYHIIIVDWDGRAESPHQHWNTNHHHFIGGVLVGLLDRAVTGDTAG